MRNKRFASLAAAIVVGGGTLLAASGANAALGVNGIYVNGVAMNGIAMNGTFNAMTFNAIGHNGLTGSAVASQGFEFNNVAVRALTWECPVPLDRIAAVFCGIGTSPGMTDMKDRGP